MSLNERMVNIMKVMLMEVELKKTFSTISSGDKINIIEVDDNKYSFIVQSNISGRIIMKDSSEKSLGKLFVLEKDSLKKNELTIYIYDNSAVSNDFKGKSLSIEVKYISVLDDKTGELQRIDITSDEKTMKQKEELSRIDEYTRIIKELDKGEMLIITTETDSEKDSIVNDLVFKVVDIKKNWYVLNLVKVRGNSEGDKSVESDKILDVVRSKELYIGKGGFFKVVDNKVSLDLRFGKNYKIPIKGIIDVDIENDNVGDTSDDKTVTDKDDFTDWLDNNPQYKNIINKTPNFFEKLSGASPKGVFQLQNMLKKAGTSNSYLTKNKYVVIKLLDGRIEVDLSNKLLSKAGKTYEAKVTDDRTLRIGDRRKGYWEIELLDEYEDKTYKTKVSFCYPNGTCDLKTNDAKIKILKVKNNR